MHSMLPFSTYKLVSIVIQVIIPNRHMTKIYNPTRFSDKWCYPTKQHKWSFWINYTRRTPNRSQHKTARFVAFQGTNTCSLSLNTLNADLPAKQPLYWSLTCNISMGPLTLALSTANHIDNESPMSETWVLNHTWNLYKMRCGRFPSSLFSKT
jgi:hypothetical protein